MACRIMRLFLKTVPIQISNYASKNLKLCKIMRCLARDASVRTNRRADHMVHFIADLSLWLDIQMFWAPRHQSMSTYSQLSFSSSTWKKGEVWMWKLGVISQERLKIAVKLLLSANRKSYNFASIGTTTDDLE